MEDVIPKADIEARMNRLKEEWHKLSMPHNLPSIIDVDIYMFGLIYWVLVKQRQLDNAKIEHLKSCITEKLDNSNPILHIKSHLHL